MAKTTDAGNVGATAETPKNLDTVVDALDFSALDAVDAEEEDEDTAEDDTEVGEGAETAGEGSEDDGEDSDDDAEAEEMSDDADDDEDDKDASKTPAKKETAPEGGIAAAIRHLDETNPEYAKAVRELQGRLSRETADRAQFDKDKAELADILKEVRELREGEEEEDIAGTNAKVQPLTGDKATDSALAKIPQAQRDLFTAALKEYLQGEGYKSETDVQREQRLKAQQDYIAQSHKTASERFGKSFGELDADGNLVVDDDNTPKGDYATELKVTRDRLAAADRGVTWDDVYKIARYDEDVKAAETRGYDKAKAELSKASRKAAAIKGSTVNSSTPGGPTRPVLYDPKKDKDPEVVYERAYRFASRLLENAG